MKNIKYFSKGVEIDIRTKEYIEKRLSTLEKLADKILIAEVEIEMDKKGTFRVEIMIKTPYNLYRAEEISESIEGSADIAVSEIKTQIKKSKDKRRTLMMRGGMSIKKKAAIDESARF